MDTSWINASFIASVALGAVTSIIVGWVFADKKARLRVDCHCVDAGGMPLVTGDATPRRNRRMGALKAVPSIPAVLVSHLFVLDIEMLSRRPFQFGVNQTALVAEFDQPVAWTHSVGASISLTSVPGERPVWRLAISELNIAPDRAPRVLVAVAQECSRPRLRTGDASVILYTGWRAELSFENILLTALASIVMFCAAVGVSLFLAGELRLELGILASGVAWLGLLAQAVIDDSLTSRQA